MSQSCTHELPLGDRLYRAVRAGLAFRDTSLRAFCVARGYPNGQTWAKKVCFGVDQGPKALQFRRDLIEYSQAHLILRAFADEDSSAHDTPMEPSIGGAQLPRHGTSSPDARAPQN